MDGVQSENTLLDLLNSKMPNTNVLYKPTLPDLGGNNFLSVDIFVFVERKGLLGPFF